MASTSSKRGEAAARPATTLWNPPWSAVNNRTEPLPPATAAASPEHSCARSRPCCPPGAHSYLLPLDTREAATLGAGGSEQGRRPDVATDVDDSVGVLNLESWREVYSRLTITFSTNRSSKVSRRTLTVNPPDRMVFCRKPRLLVSRSITSDAR